VSARRAVARWSLRLFRREWRQQVLVLALLTFAVAAAILGATAAYNATPSRDAEFGSADFRLSIGARDPKLVDEQVARIRQQFGTVELVGRRVVPVPGSVDGIELRAQDPNGPYGRPMLGLRAGRYPTAAGEVAVTDGAAGLFDVRIGDTVSIDRSPRHVVGLVENPGAFDDEFILVPPRSLEPLTAVTALVRGTDADASAIFGRPGGTTELRTGAVVGVEARGTTEKGTAAALVLGMATIVLLLVALVAAAGFVAVAQRRQRQLGMLASIGATDRHLRLVVVADGFGVGMVAAVAGTILALAGWLVVASPLEHAAGHRIDRGDVPLPVVGLGVVLAVATAMASAWWPARVAARIPIMEALSARPPRPKLARRSAIAAAAFIVVGFIGLSTGVNVTGDGSVHPVQFIGGMVAIGFGVLFISPVAIRAVAACASRLPVAGRLALRDLGRYQARSGAALAAISLGLGISVTIAVIAAAETNGASEGNLAAQQMLVRTNDPHFDGAIAARTPEQLQALRNVADRMAAQIPGARTISLAIAASPAVEESIPVTKGTAAAIAGGRVASHPSQAPAILVRRLAGGRTYRWVGPLFMATPEALTAGGIDPASVRSDVDVVTATKAGALHLQTVNAKPEAVRAQHVDAAAYSSAPTSFVTAAGLQRFGLVGAPSGWLIVGRHGLSHDQISAARKLAADAGMTIEVRDHQGGVHALQTGATAAGVLLALGILAMTVGLIRAESASDLRTLTAAGATSVTRRWLTAATAAALATAGAVLGIAGAYITLVAAYSDRLSDLDSVPIRHLAVTAIGLPLIAAAAGWLLAGREPATITRQVVME